MNPGTVIATVTGHQLDLMNPHVSSALSARMVSHHLALINRFTGATFRPYSVAEHSLFVCEIVAREHKLDVHGQIAALLHDAHESIVGDISTPLKSVLGRAWSETEHRWQSAFQSAFCIRTPSHVFARQIKDADLRALATERRDLLPSGLAEWPVLRGVDPIDWINLNERAGFTWTDWCSAFTEKLEELEFERERAMVRIGHKKTP